MTLNISLITPEAIYQSADFRLTDTTTGKIVTDSSNKLVSLQYSAWDGFITYTGVGKWKDQDTAALVCQWLDDSPGASAMDVASIIAERGTELLRRIEQETDNRMPHTFSLAAFEETNPWFVLISNWEEVTGRQTAAINDVLDVSEGRFKGKPVVVVTGNPASISREDRRALSRLARRRQDSARIRKRLSDLNSQAASRTQSVSPECTVISLLPDGSGFQELSDNRRVVARSIMNGHYVNYAELAKLVPGLKVAHFVGSSFASGKPPVAREPCTPELVAQDKNAGSLVELTLDGARTSAARAINHGRQVVGAAEVEKAPGSYGAVLWTEAENPTELGFTFDSTWAMDINGRSEVVGSARLSSGEQHAVLWSKGKLIDLGTYRGRYSAATAINDTGSVAGYVSVSPTETGQIHQRPARWRSTKFEVMEDLPTLWGNAVDINSRSDALVLGCDDWPIHYAFLWKSDGSLDLLGGEISKGIYPIAISDEVILALGRDRARDSVALLFRDQRWEPLGTPPTYNPSCLSPSGLVAGYVHGEGFDRPWVRHLDGKIQMLPYMKYHSCRPAGINDDGWLVGTARSDHGTHAILWRPE